MCREGAPGAGLARLSPLAGGSRVAVVGGSTLRIPWLVATRDGSVRNPLVSVLTQLYLCFCKWHMRSVGSVCGDE